MDSFLDIIQSIENPEHQNRFEEVLNWVTTNFPSLKQEIKWHQPMFSDHGTFIIGFSVSKQHIAIAPEQVSLDRFKEDIEKSGYNHTSGIIRIKWNQEVDFELLKKIIDFNIVDKAGYTTFWR